MGIEKHSDNPNETQEFAMRVISVLKDKEHNICLHAEDWGEVKAVLSRTVTTLDRVEKTMNETKVEIAKIKQERTTAIAISGIAGAIIAWMAEKFFFKN